MKKKDPRNEVALGRVLRLEGPTLDAITFSHSETLSITRLTDDALHNRYKRKLLPADQFPQRVGRGNKRRYGVEQISFLAVAQVLMGIGVSAEDTVILAPMIVETITELFVSLKALSVSDALEQIKATEFSMFVIFTMQGVVKAKPAFGKGVIGVAAKDSCLMRVMPSDTAKGLLEVSRQLGSTYMVVDAASVAFDVIKSTVGLSTA